MRERAMRLAYERGEALFNYQGLRSFKDKWDPQWHPRFVAFTSDPALPKVAVAIARAGELPDPTRWLDRAQLVARKLPATLCLGALVIWFMAATNADPGLHHELLRHIGLAWRDLLHLQLWRLPTSQLAETTAGFVWSNVALLLISLPIAEWRLGTKRTVAVFFLCDWASTLTTLVALRLIRPWSPWAAHALTVRDAGPSAGAWALATTLALTLPSRRARQIVGGPLFVFLCTTLVVHHRLFDLQHLLAALAALAGVAVLDADRRRRSRRIAHPDRPVPPTDAAGGRVAHANAPSAGAKLTRR